MKLDEFDPDYDPVTTLITGCDFYDPRKERWIHGNLHQIANILVFDASYFSWIWCVDEPLRDRMAVMCPVYYEKKGQIVFPIEFSQFNARANAHLTKTLNLDGMNGEAPRIPRKH